MSKVITGNGGFKGCLLELQGVSAWWKETAQTRVVLHSRSLLPNHFTPRSSKEQTLTTHDANRNYRIRFTLLRDNPCRNSYILAIH